jgi:uncharacterized membrane protein HdeD (DUF308 family)
MTPGESIAWAKRQADNRRRAEPGQRALRRMVTARCDRMTADRRGAATIVAPGDAPRGDPLAAFDPGTRTRNQLMTESHHTETFGERITSHAGTWLMVTALLFMLLGIAAIVEPFVAGLAITAVVGFLLIAGGITHIISVVRRDDGGAVWHVTLGLVYMAAGVYFLSHPLMALAALTLLLAMLLFVEAGVDLVAYSAQRREPGAVWLLGNAFMTALLGTLIAMHWPSLSVWAVGTLVGINLLTTGFSRLMLGTAARTIAREVRA